MTHSEFLGYAARSVEEGIPVLPMLAPQGWNEYICLTLPVEGDVATPKDYVQTRVLRFLLAAEVARSEGK